MYFEYIAAAHSSYIMQDALGKQCITDIWQPHNNTDMKKGRFQTKAAKTIPNFVKDAGINICSPKRCIYFAED